MQPNNITSNKMKLLISKKQQALANLIAGLDEKQFLLLQKYLQIDEMYQKRKYAELINTILTNKKTG